MNKLDYARDKYIEKDRMNLCHVLEILGGMIQRHRYSRKDVHLPHHIQMEISRELRSYSESLIDIMFHMDHCYNFEKEEINEDSPQSIKNVLELIKELDKQDPNAL